MAQDFDLVLRAPEAVLPALADAAVKGAVVLAAAGLLVLALRRSSAAARHLVWCLALAAVVALPMLSAVLPGWSLPLVAPWGQDAVPALPAEPFVAPGPVAQLPAPGDAVSLPPAAPAQPGPAAEQAAEPVPALVRLGAAWPLLVWMFGAFVTALPVGGGLVSLRRLRCDCRPFDSGRTPQVLTELVAEMGLRRRVALLQSPRRCMPMTWGVVRPVVLLPAGAESWPEERLRAVLLHELAHVQRWDCLTQVLAQMVRAVYWFNPFAWLAVGCLRAEQEHACDDAVLRSGAGAADYAEHLLAVTSGARRSWWVAPVALAVGRASAMERRLRTVLDPHRDRRPVTRPAVGLAALVAVALLLPLAAVGLSTAATAEPETRAAAAEPQDKAAEPDPAQKLAEVRDKLRQMYIKKPDEKVLNEGAIKGMVEALGDPYSSYLSADQLKEMERSFRGGFTGIGAQLQLKDGKLTVVTPLDDSPALKAGLRPGDVIAAVDGKPTKGLEIAEAVKLILGEKGTVVKLKVERAGAEATEMAITRGPVKILTALGFRRGGDDHWDFLLDPDAKIGYVRITQFGPTTAEEVRTVVKGLLDKGMKGLVLDLRFCPGGLLNAAVEVAGLFLGQGAAVVTVKGTGKEQAFQADGKNTLGDFPLLVLLDEHTASAAEVVAGALADNGRATLLGTRSYGKGSVQSIVNLEGEGGALKLTTAHFYRPNGRNIDNRAGEKTWGVDPDDGLYVPVGGKQAEALLKAMREREVLGRKDAPKPEKVTPKRIEEEYSDPQLAGGLTAMTARLTKGAFEKVGKGNAALLADVSRREALQKQREALLKDLEKIDKDLSDLEKKP